MTCPLRFFDSLWEEGVFITFFIFYPKNNDDRKVIFLLVDYSLFQRQFLNERFPGPCFPRDRTIKCKWTHRNKSAQVYSYLHALYRFKSYLSLRVFQLTKDGCLGGCICVRYYLWTLHVRVYRYILKYYLSQCFSGDRFQLFLLATFLCIHRYSSIHVD